eukprot:CAMPEP_0118882228 /NCGR_PEP_ID=MMETSP1163-20130328/21518_1 /TAXON_ID=124430 /ORGANISM="Phaeomonas parva, Strain CCMP2877" /LENGTH=102 /DNA_ID=CAMNT_0006819211 /DNA_START=190 /DNA_END=495 /DNA_ORIENTATION=-
MEAKEAKKKRSVWNWMGTRAKPKPKPKPQAKPNGGGKRARPETPLEAGLSTLEAAVAADEAADFARARALYPAALEDLLSAAKTETDAAKKELILSKVGQYM